MRITRAPNWLSVAIATVSLALPATAGAGVVYWDMGTAAPAANGVVDLSVSTISRGNAANTDLLAAVSSSTGYSFALDGTIRPASGDNNAGAAARGGVLDVAGSSYFALTLTNDAGHPMSVQSFGFGSRCTSSGPLSYSMRSSLDSFAADLDGATGNLTTNSVWSYQEQTLSSPLTIAPGTSVDLRFYGFGGSAAANISTVNWRIDDLQITVVPEPAAAVSVTIAVLSLVGCIVRSRRWLSAPLRGS